MADLNAVAEAMVAPGKGILAADESSPTIAKRLSGINVESTEQNRLYYRNLLFTTQGYENFIAGVILFDETLRQSSPDTHNPFAKLLAGRGVIPGIKVDKGAKPLPGSPEEKVTEGLDGLRERLQEYRSLGAQFAKWRAVITITQSTPTRNAIQVNAHALARYAALCQEENLVPIVEPEVLMDGTHTIDRSYDVSRDTFHAVFDELHNQGVSLQGMILKPNMVLSGYHCPDQATEQKVAEKTVACLRETVPAAVPGITFLSGGQSDEKAIAHLKTMNSLYGQKVPWKLSFSYGRALQQLALKTWNGQTENKTQAQQALFKRAEACGLATLGRSPVAEPTPQTY